MEDAHEPADRHSLQGSHRDMKQEAAAAFVPLRLVLEPVGLRLEVTRASAVVGRHSGADIRLALADISRRHCRVFFEGGQWRIEDLHSLNGVFVNGERIQEATLHNGDWLQLGKFTFRIEHAIPAVSVDDARADILKSIAEAIMDQKLAG